jgi:hypothetical protein
VNEELYLLSPQAPPWRVEGLLYFTFNRAYYVLHPILKSQSVHRNTKIIIYKTLIRSIITYGAEAWTMSSETGKRLAVFEREVLRKLLEAIKINNCWIRRHNNELMQLYGDLGIVSFIRMNRLRWIGHVNIMDNKRMLYQVFANQPQGSRPRGRPKYRWWDCVYGDIRKFKIQNWELKAKAVPLHAMKALGGRGGIAPTHSRPRH